MTYREQIRDPKWIQFATAFKKAKGWRCEACGAAQSSTNELSVHHIYYMSGVMMWEHPEGLLECLCSGCHKFRQKIQQQAIASFAESLNLRRQREQKAKDDFAASLELRKNAAPEPAPILEAESPFPAGHIPYSEYLEHLEKWKEVMRSFQSRYPLQAGYLSDAMFAGIDAGGTLELRFKSDRSMAVDGLRRPVVMSALSGMCQGMFPSFVHIRMEVLDEAGQKRPRIIPTFDQLRQLLG